MITDDLKHKTMSAMEWISLLNLDLHICDSCKGFTPSVFEASLDASWYSKEVGIPNSSFVWYETPDVKYACFDCEQLAQSRKAEAEQWKRETEKRHAAGIFGDDNKVHGSYVRPTTINKTGFVYVCKVSGHKDVYKIGATISKNGVRGRISGQPDLSLDGLVCSLRTKDPFGLEKFLHTCFYKSRVENVNTIEWFELDQTDIDFIKNMKRYDGNDITIKEYAP